jgi:CRP/FNR family transcriptional regulator, cyclic AMP receptor protein
MSERETVEFLATVPLLLGSDDADLHEIARVLRRRTAQVGEVLWGQGDLARELVFIVEGAVSASLQAPGDRVVEIGRAGPGEVVGEIGLLEGGTHTMTVQATESATLLALSRHDFGALLARPGSSAFRLKRRLASQLTGRLRNQLAQLALTLGGTHSAPPDEDPAQVVAGLEPCRPPDSRYLSRMATFHDFDAVALWGFLTSGSYAMCPSGRTLLAEGAPSPACYLTINGAVEKVLVRDDRRVRVGLAGPGKPFGYESLIDGRPSPVTAITRERTLLLVLPHDPFKQLFGREDAIARVFLDVLLRDLVATLRLTLRPHARLVASV